MQNVPWTKMWSFLRHLDGFHFQLPSPRLLTAQPVLLGKKLLCKISSPSTCDFFWDTQVKFPKDISLDVKIAGPQFPNLHSGYQEKSYLDQKTVLKIKLKNEKTNRKVHRAVKIWALMGFFSLEESFWEGKIFSLKVIVERGWPQQFFRLCHISEFAYSIFTCGSVCSPHGLEVH